tara:strand:+ start:152 stop:538 length:387 start_codon:yes stop_codon:yes gene_type:complete
MKNEILGAKAPKKACTDQNCPFHGRLNVKPEVFQGTIVKKDAHHSATIEWKRIHNVPKYERFELRRSHLRVHNPPCLDAQVGQEVLVAKTRPLSKTKHHVVIQLIKGKKKTERKVSEDEIESKKSIPK